MPAATVFNPGDQINYTGNISGYLQTPGVVQPDQGDGLTRILWADGFAMSVLSASYPSVSNFEVIAAPQASPNLET
jgi:hypothetical protein